MSALIKADDAAKVASQVKDISENLLVTPSPSLNWATHGGIPKGHITVLWGPEGSSKSTIAMNLIAQLQKEDPEAIALWFDTEFSFSPKWAQTQGVNADLVMHRSGNIGSEIFDYIKNTAQALSQEGAPIKAIIIDSVTNMVGPKENNQDSTGDQVIGDLSKFLGVALKSIMQYINQHNILCVLISQARTNMDPNTSKYEKYILPSGMTLRHNTSLVVRVEKISSKDSIIVDETSNNMNDTGEVVGKKIRAKVTKTRSGGEGRVAEFTLHFSQGIINQGEEVAKLGINQGVIQRPNNRTYVLPGGKSLVGFAALVKSLSENPEEQKTVMDAIWAKGEHHVEVLDSDPHS
jgi:recombination protein RecA